MIYHICIPCGRRGAQIGKLRVGSVQYFGQNWSLDSEVNSRSDYNRLFYSCRTSHRHNRQKAWDDSSCKLLILEISLVNIHPACPQNFRSKTTFKKFYLYFCPIQKKQPFQISDVIQTCGGVSDLRNYLTLPPNPQVRNDLLCWVGLGSTETWYDYMERDNILS